jgi:acyl-coenzyme A thioesterase PaaI-like protein
VTGEQLADAIRELIEQVATSAGPDEAVADAAGAVRAATERLRAAGSPRAMSFGAGGDPWTYRRLSPVSGAINPLAPPVRYAEIGEGTIDAGVTFGVAYQGPPGYVHGAFIAGVFDDVLGAANMASGNPGMTVRLEVRYRRPTPLNTPLRVVARHSGREGRRIFASGTMLAGADVTAEAEGVFAEITLERARELFANNLPPPLRGRSTPIALRASGDPGGGGYGR